MKKIFVIALLLMLAGVQAVMACPMHEGKDGAKASGAEDVLEE